MTEIPEHLLARSRARKAAAAGEAAAATDAPTTGGELEKATPAGAPVAAAARTPATAPAPPPPPKPDPPYIKAAKDRKKIPFWVMPVLVGLPLWALLFAFTLEPPSKASVGWEAQGEEIFGKCATCHGGGGEGLNGPALAGGTLGETFADYKDQIEWVSLGSELWRAEHGDTYGDNAKPVKGGMPGWSSEHGFELTPGEVAIIVRYEREVISGLEPEPELVALTEEAAAEGGGAAAGHN
jgi:mono/diheme cytochrome c family protein